MFAGGSVLTVATEPRKGSTRMANTSYSDELARRFTGYANQAAAKARFFTAEAECWRSMGYHHTAARAFFRLFYPPY